MLYIGLDIFWLYPFSPRIFRPTFSPVHVCLHTSRRGGDNGWVRGRERARAQAIKARREQEKISTRSEVKEKQVHVVVCFLACKSQQSQMAFIVPYQLMDWDVSHGIIVTGSKITSISSSFEGNEADVIRPDRSKGGEAFAKIDNTPE